MNKQIKINFGAGKKTPRLLIYRDQNKQIRTNKSYFLPDLKKIKHSRKKSSYKNKKLNAFHLDCVIANLYLEINNSSLEIN
jgi:ribosomal protein S24E